MSPIRGILATVLALGVVQLACSSPAPDVHGYVKDGDLKALAAALEDRPELVSARDEAGRTPLHLACRGDHPDAVALLLERGADVDALDDFSNAPMHSLAVRDLAAPMQLLIDHGAAVDPVNHEGDTPLHLAAAADAGDAVAVLLAAGADPEIANGYGRTALVLAARERGGPRTCRLLLEGGASPAARDRFDDDALALAAWRGKEDVVDLLLEAGATLPTGKAAARELFGHAADHGLERLFAALVASGADPVLEDGSGGNLIHAAAAGGSLEILRSLAARGIDLAAADDFGWTPLHYAARDGRLECVRWLSEQRIDLDARSLAGETAFTVATERAMEPVAEVLRAAGADTSPARFPTLEGPYLGQPPPGATPRKFATGIVSSVWSLHSTVAFSPDGDLALWSPMVEYPGEVYSRGDVLISERREGRWSRPEWAPFTREGRGDVPFFAPDGSRVYFLSRRTLRGEPESQRERLWYADRNGDGWMPSRLVDATVNDFPQHWQFSVDRDHAIYFSADLPEGLGGGDLYRADFVDGAWRQPVNLGPPVNSEDDESTPFIAPDGSYLIVQRSGDLYLSFRSGDGGWGEPRALGEGINTPEHELCPIVSPDGRYLFFLRSHAGKTHAWWVEAGFLTEP